MHETEPENSDSWPLIDIGANLADPSFDADRNAVLERASGAGVQHIVVTGSSQASNETAQELIADHPQLLSATAGLHPHHASDWCAALHGQIDHLAAAGKLVAVGEAGLDYFRDLSPRDAQRSAFVAQLELAATHALPVFLHQRDAHEDFIAILREHRPSLPACVVHCFTDTRDALGDYLALNCHIGFTGWICDERRGKHLIEAVIDIPAGRLMLETDAPYLMPRTIRPRPKTRRNEPANLPYVLTAVAAARSETAKQTAEHTTATAREFFKLPAV